MARKAELVRGYAEALFSIAEAEGSLDIVEDELFSFAKAIEHQGNLREALTDPALPVERKRALIEELLGKGAGRHTVNILEFLIEQGRSRELSSIIERLAEVAAERRQQSLAEVRTALPLSDKQLAGLRAALSKAMGRSIEVKVVVDPTVIGGVIARVGDEVLDGTVRIRLEQARERLGSV